jgi:TolB-like protein
MILALGAALLCSNVMADFQDFPATVQIGGGAASNTLNQVSSFLATQLARNRDIKNVSDSRIAVASFVNMTTLDETDRLGMTLAENLMHEMYVRGFGVVDFKARDHVKVRSNGDFVFSRDVAELRRNHNIHYFLAGTLARNGDGIVINARLIQADSGVIVSSGQAFLNNRDLNYILSDANRGAVEKVVVERSVVPPLKPNTVFIR